MKFMGGYTNTTIHNTSLPQFEWGDLRMTAQLPNFILVSFQFQASFILVSS